MPEFEYEVVEVERERVNALEPSVVYWKGGGTLRLNRRAVECLGAAEYVQFLVDRKGNRLALSPATADTPHSHFLKVGRSGIGFVRCKRIIWYLQREVTTAERYDAHCLQTGPESSVLTFPMPDGSGRLTKQS